MKKIITILLIMLLPLAVFAEGGMQLDKAHIDLSDNASLERGAKNFVTYCLGCHSTKYIRYLRIARDFNVQENKVLKEIAPLGAGIYDKMNSAMNAHDAEKWFGTMPPDLSLVARSRGADWLYSYLTGFYTDDSRPFGVNNRVFESVSMPHVLWQLQGTQNAVFKQENGQQVLDKLVLAEPGELTPQEFERFTNDLVNFLVYAGEPAQLERQSMGKYVLFFIFMFLILAYLLKREYWKDVH